MEEEGCDDEFPAEALEKGGEISGRHVAMMNGDPVLFLCDYAMYVGFQCS